MVTEQTLIKFGLTKDENNLKLKEVFKDNIKLKEVHIDCHPENPLVTSSVPFMLLLRTIEKKVSVSNDEDRLVLIRNDGFNTYFMNVPFAEITECYYKGLDNCFEFILNIQNIWYRITVLN